MENNAINFRATLVITRKRSSYSAPYVLTIERRAKDFNSFLEMVSSQYCDCDELVITNIEIFDKSNYTVKYVKGERVL